MIEEIEAMRHFKDEYETSKHYGSDLIIELDDAKTLLNLIQKQDTEINKLNKEKEYYKKLYNESYNFLDPKFTGDHIPRID